MRALISLLVSIVLLVFVGTMFVFGQEWMQLGRDGAIDDVFSHAASSPWALFGVISIYSLLALTGFPQILMIVATVAAFGPLQGAIYSWIATMMSASLTFGFGHLVGGQWVKKFGGERGQATIDFLAQHGALASGLIRVVPSAPFIVVNTAAGAAHIPVWKYWLGSGIGIIPKIALVAGLGALVPDASYWKQGVNGVVAFFQSRAPGDLLLMALIIPAWLVFLYLVRKIYGRLIAREGRNESQKTPNVTDP